MEAFFEEARSREMRVIAGLTGVDKFAPEEYCISPEDFYIQSKQLIEQFHQRDCCLYPITPSFAVGCSEVHDGRSLQSGPLQHHHTGWQH
jgi:guanine deaminase